MTHSWMSHLPPADVAEFDQWGAANRDGLKAAVDGAVRSVAMHGPVGAAGLLQLAFERMGHHQLAVTLAWALVTLAEQRTARVPHFNPRHPLAAAAERVCVGHDGQVLLGVACGPCWEAVIRHDALGVARG